MFKTLSRSTSSKTPVMLAVLLFALVLSIGVVTTKTVSTNNFVQVSEDSVVNTTENSVNTVTKAEQFAQIVNTSKPVYALNFIALCFILLLLIVGAAVILEKANIFVLVNLFVESLFYTKKKNGGVIFDGKTDLPIALASVKVLRKNASSNELTADVVETVITDLDGRYRINTVPSRNFSIEVNALGYESVTKTLTSNLDISVKEMQESTYIRKFLSVEKSKLFFVLRLAGITSAIWGYVVTIFAEVAAPNIVNILLIAIYSVLFILAVYPRLYSLFLRKFKVVDEKGSIVIAAVVRIYSSKDLVDFALTGKKGIVKFNLTEGIYSSTTTKAGYSYNESQFEITEESRVVNEILLTSSNQNELENLDVDLHDQVIQNNHEKFNLH